MIRTYAVAKRGVLRLNDWSYFSTELDPVHSVQVNEPCASILLDSIELNVSGVELQSGESKIAAKEIKELKDEDRVEFVMDELVPKGKRFFYIQKI